MAGRPAPISGAVPGGRAGAVAAAQTLTGVLPAHHPEGEHAGRATDGLVVPPEEQELGHRPHARSPVARGCDHGGTGGGTRGGDAGDHGREAGRIAGAEHHPRHVGGTAAPGGRAAAGIRQAGHATGTYSHCQKAGGGYGASHRRSTAGGQRQRAASAKLAAELPERGQGRLLVRHGRAQGAAHRKDRDAALSARQGRFWPGELAGAGGVRDPAPLP